MMMTQAGRCGERKDKDRWIVLTFLSAHQPGLFWPDDTLFTHLSTVHPFFSFTLSTLSPFVSISSSFPSLHCLRWAGSSPLTPGRSSVLLVSTDWGPFWDGQFCRREYNGGPASLCYPPCMYDWMMTSIRMFSHVRKRGHKEPKLDCVLE